MRNRWKLLVALAVLVAASVVNAAAPVARTKGNSDLDACVKSFEHDACIDAQTDPATTQACLSKELTTADAALNAAYQGVLKDLAGNTARLDMLKAAQRAWVDFRDKDCQWSASQFGGVTAGMAVVSCKVSKTLCRKYELNFY